MQTSIVSFAPLLGMAMCIALSPARADQACYDKAQNQAQLTECSVVDLKQTDDKLNRLYKDMQDRLKGDEKTRKLLEDAQKKWLAFRDAECTLQTVRTAGGSINAMNVNACLAAVTQARVKDLQSYLECARQSGAQGAEDCTVPRSK